jgi:UDP-N-acetylmuramoyl-tripeptide--D-alanyl-D-alanine ligase
MKYLYLLFSPLSTKTVIYMLQQYEYKSAHLVRWLLSGADIRRAQRRGTIVYTARTKMTAIVAYALYITTIASGIYFALSLNNLSGVVIILLANIFVYTAVYVFNLFIQIVINILARRVILSSKHILDQHKAVRIAVLGSYGKTTMKEMLATVLSEGKNVAATPGNKNVLISHARWVKKLTGNEDVLVIEYGEGAPGDINMFAKFSKPDFAVVTGAAEAHLDQYRSLEEIQSDFATILQFIKPENIYANSNTIDTQKFTNTRLYSDSGLTNIVVQDVMVDSTGTSFTVSRGGNVTTYKTGLLGKHQVGPVLAVIDIAKQLGLSNVQIQRGLEKVVPYRHRMSPRFIHGACIIDDTYNGNIEGMRVGLELLKELPGQRKVYVTPGLVDQGDQTENVHVRLGKMIAEASPDMVVLMQNSATNFIQQGIAQGKYKGVVTIKDDPLDFYTNIEHFVVGGDIVLMQNDWPDSYQ